MALILAGQPLPWCTFRGIFLLEEA